MKRFRLSLLIIGLLFSSGLFAQEQQCSLSTNMISGVYRGKNLFFKNDEVYGIRRLYLNDKLIGDKFGSRFEVDLSSLKLGDKVKLKIIFCEKSPEPYKLLNPEDIREKKTKK